MNSPSVAVYLQNAKLDANRAVIAGAEYLATKFRSVTDPFQMSLVAYALDKAGHISKEEAFKTLQSMARTGNKG